MSLTTGKALLPLLALFLHFSVQRFAAVVLFALLCFETGCIPNWPHTGSVVKDGGLELQDPLASTSQVLGSEDRATYSAYVSLFLCTCYNSLSLIFFL